MRCNFITVAFVACIGACSGSTDDGGSRGAQGVCGSGGDGGALDGGALDGAALDAAAAADLAVGAPEVDLAPPPGADAGLLLCSVNGNLGQCMDATTCAALPAFAAIAGYCPGPASVQCCVLAPSTANNPPIPSGWVLMQQAAVTAEMTTWAVAILHDPVTYPMFSFALRTFGALTVMARVEWHPPDFQNSAIHRGVTLFQP
jgi:hypothetical protein